MSKSTTSSPIWSRGPMVFGVLLTFSIVGFWVWSMFYWPQCPEMGPCKTNWDTLRFDSSPNEIGDMLAGFAGALAFVWIVVTVLLQAAELSDQRKVLTEQRDEFSAQNANMKEQIFESTFFQMLSSLGEIIEAIDLNDPKSGRTNGRDCFRIYYGRLTRAYHADRKLPEYSRKEIVELSEDFFNQHGHEFAHYFRLLFNFFKFLSSSTETKTHHAKVLRAYLSDFELALLFYNCLTPDGKNFKEYISKYELFDNLPLNTILDQEHLKLYDRRSFGMNRRIDLMTEAKE